ncbi:MAG: helix-turn-helix transcriptional regulator [Planctomycetes bacterium]|nr:helix-turn-helix transcriptional regulator [Planctomycetota bacterium]
MKPNTRRRLQAAGWSVGTPAQFLELSAVDEAFVELKVALAKALRAAREKKGLTQAQVARAVGSSQPRVAFMEASEASVSVDLLVRTLLALGSSLTDLAAVIRAAGRRRSA